MRILKVIFGVRERGGKGVVIEVHSEHKLYLDTYLKKVIIPNKSLKFLKT